MSYLIAIISALFAIFLVVSLHEWGHFLAARWMGVHVERFSIGFGRALFKRTDKRGTDFILAWLPLGGYVKMYGDGSSPVPEDKQDISYAHKSVWRRMVIVLAGPLMNFVLAIVLLLGVYSIGFKQAKPIVGKVVIASIAARAGVRPGDEIVTIDHHPVTSWQQIVIALISRIGDVKPIGLIVENKLSKRRALMLDVSKWRLSSATPDLFPSLGFLPFSPPVPAVLAEIEQGSSAHLAGLKPGDKILTIKGKKITSWQQAVDLIRARPRQTLNFVILRAGMRHEVTVQLAARKVLGKVIGFLGAGVRSVEYPSRLQRHIQYPIWLAIKPAIAQTWVLTQFNAVVLWKMLSNQISLRTLGGPITIFNAAGHASLQGLVVYLNFIAYISITLGFLNILPIPMLDGGHFLFQLIELIRRRPVSESVQTLCMRIGLIFIVTVMIFAVGNDLIRLFG